MHSPSQIFGDSNLKHTKQIGIYTIGELFNRASKIASIFILATIMTKTEFGKYNYIIALTSFFLVTFDFGINMMLILRGSNDKLRRLFSIFIYSKLLIYVFTIPCIIFLKYNIPAKDGNSSMMLLYAAIAVSLCIDLHSFFTFANRANLNYLAEAKAKLIAAVVFLGILFALGITKAKIDVYQAILIQCISLLVALTYAVYCIINFGVDIYGVNRNIIRGVKAVLALSIPYTVAAVLAALFNSIDQMIIGQYSEFEYLATFAVVQKIIILMFIPASIIQSYIFPHIATIKYVDGANGYLENYLKFALYLGIALSQICILGVEFIVMPFLIDKGYGDILDLTRIMILCLPFMYLHSVFWTLLMARRMTVLANMPATLIVLLIAVVDIMVLEFNEKEFLVWSPVLANILLLIGLAWLYHRRIEALVLSSDIRKKFSIFIVLNVILSFAANSPSIILDFVRFAFVFYSLIEIWQIMRHLKLKNVITWRSP